jgi:hypothetical protein
LAPSAQRKNHRAGDCQPKFGEITSRHRNRTSSTPLVQLPAHPRQIFRHRAAFGYGKSAYLVHYPRPRSGAVAIGIDFPLDRHGVRQQALFSLIEGSE